MAAVVGMQFKELASSMGRASDLGDAVLERGLVPAVVVAYQFAVPARQERASVRTGAALGEVVDHRAQFAELSRRIRPQVCPVRFALAGTEHLHRRLVGVQHRLLPDGLTSRWPFA